MTALVGTLETAAQNLAENYPARQVVRTDRVVWLENATDPNFRIVAMQHDTLGLLAPEVGEATLELSPEWVFKIWGDVIQQTYNEREGGKLQKTGGSERTVDGPSGSPGEDRHDLRRGEGPGDGQEAGADEDPPAGDGDRR